MTTDLEFRLVLYPHDEAEGAEYVNRVAVADVPRLLEYWHKVERGEIKHARIKRAVLQQRRITEWQPVPHYTAYTTEGARNPHTVEELEARLLTRPLRAMTDEEKERLYARIRAAYEEGQLHHRHLIPVDEGPEVRPMTGEELQAALDRLPKGDVSRRLLEVRSDAEYVAYEEKGEPAIPPKAVPLNIVPRRPRPASRVRARVRDVFEAFIERAFGTWWP